MKRIRIAALVGMGVVLLAGFLILGRPKSAEGPAQGGVVQAAAAPAEKRAGPEPIAVTAFVVAPRDLRQTLEVTGSLKSDLNVQVGARIPGKVLQVAVKEGDRVQAGQLLVRLEDRELRADLDRARALLAANQAKLSYARNQATAKDTSAESDYQRALAQRDMAKSRVQQAETNAKLTESQTQTAVDTAASGVKQATDNLAIVKDRTRKQDLKQAQLAVDQSLAQLDQAKVDMENARQVFDRRRTLYQQDAIAKEEVDEAERHFKGAQSTVTTNQASVEASKERLSLAQEGSRPEEVRIAEGQYNRAERALRLAQSELRRNDLAQKELVTAKAAVDQAQAAVDAAKAGLVQSKMSLDDVAAARAAIEQARGDIGVYETQLSDLTIRAPVSGVVSARQVNAGEMVTPAKPLLTLVAMDAVYFEARVPELEVAQLRPGAAADVTVDALPGRRFSGTVREVIPVADRSTKTYRVRVGVQAPPSTLPANGYARALVNVGMRSQALAVPKESLHSEAGDDFVWLIAPGKNGGPSAKRQLVTVGLVDRDYAEIRAGLKAGDRIVGPGAVVVEDAPLKTD